MDSNNMNNDDHEPVYASGGKLIFANEENRKLVLVQNKNNGDLMYALYEDIQEIFNLEPLSKETKKTDETLHHDEMKNNVIETTCDEEGKKPERNPVAIASSSSEDLERNVVEPKEKKRKTDDAERRHQKRMQRQLYVVEKCVMGVEVLIGQNFTELYDVSYLKIGNSLRFENAGITIGPSIHSISEKVLNVGVNDPEIVNSLVELINEFEFCTAQNYSEIGKASSVEMKIQLTTEKPVCHRPRQFSEFERIKIREIVDELLANGIVRESQSPYASPVLLVKKKNGQLRLVVDYRALNKITVQDKYPLPLIEEQLRRLAGGKFFTSLDLFSGYYHIPVSEDSIHYTAFITQDGHYEFTRVPFGLTNAPAVFQRMINTALGQLRFSKVLIYLDDILIPAPTISESLHLLRIVLKVLQDNGLTLNLKKCYFLKKQIEYLGYEITESTIKPSKRKIEAAEEFPKPTNVHEV
ncbi:Retrovirus-related Pol polyprotein from transposon 297-like Protein [Tribolium castaneum]|uniref:Retrovirus-related Pol polyprotein from transposon 297-like Protein n=1 Tax=Tribolium castaneum TaxID=7070 RepID=D7EJ04_TRICA|nr:Retrovirus-related Pol polyprotein from transposon 297-like Protein [Tribolium castaneum]